jgi:type I restriction enzyme M protein
MANPPFAGDIKESAILTRYDLAKNEKGKWASKVGRDILFIERNLSFLKPGGRMAIVLPQGRFNNSSDKRIRDFIAERCRILAVVGLHVNVFKPHTGTKTSVLFVQKWDDELCPRRDDYPIFFATMQKPSKDNSGDKIYVKDADGEPLLDRHGHLIVDHDLYNHDGLTQDGIAEAFTQFAKRERLSFFADARPFDADYYTALMSGLEAVEVKKSKLERTMRVDSEFYSKENLRIDAVLNKLTKNSVVDLFCVSDGNHMAIADEFSDDGIRYYRGQDISNFFIEDATPIHITENTYNTPIMIRSHLQKGDVLLSIVGTIGKTALVYTEKKQTCSCKLAILRPRNSGTSEIGAVFLACKYGQNQIQKFIRGAVQMGFLLEDMNQIHIPNFSDDLCDNIAKTIGKMHNLRQKSISRYAAAETRLLSALGLQNFNPAPGAIAEKSFSESFGASGRLDAEYYQLKYEQYEYAIKSNTGGVTTVFENFTLVTNKCDRRKESYPYIEIGDINVGNGSYNYNIIETPDLPDNAKISVNPSDLIVSKVRPYRGAVAIIDDYVDDLVVSSAFCVLRPKSNYNINVLATLFRTPVYRDWFLKWNVGSSYPVIKDEDVLNMSIPILSLDVQSAISKEVQNSSALRRQSEQLLDAAKRAVEIAIEEGEEKAITWLDGEVRDCG